MDTLLSKHLSLRLSPAQRDALDLAVSKSQYRRVTDFAREAIMRETRRVLAHVAGRPATNPK